MRPPGTSVVACRRRLVCAGVVTQLVALTTQLLDGDGSGGGDGDSGGGGGSTAAAAAAAAAAVLSAAAPHALVHVAAAVAELARGGPVCVGALLRAGALPAPSRLLAAALSQAAWRRAGGGAGDGGGSSEDDEGEGEGDGGAALEQPQDAQVVSSAVAVPLSAVAYAATAVASLTGGAATSETGGAVGGGAAVASFLASGGAELLWRLCGLAASDG